MTASKLRAAAAALLLGTATMGGAVLLTTPAMAQGVRPEVGNALNEAKSLAAAGNYKAAMAKVNQAEAVPDKTAAESQIVAAMKSYIGTKSGDVSLGGAAAGKGKLANDYNARNYAGVIADGDALKKAGGIDTQDMQVVAQSYYLSGNKPGCIKYIKSNFPNPDDTTLELLMRCAYDANDDVTQRSALETLVAHTGKADYWASLLKLSERATGLSDRQTLSIYRLKLLTGTINGKEEYTTLAQLLIQLKLPAEAQSAIEKGGALLADAKSQRLLALAKQQAAAVQSGMAAEQAAAAKDPNGDAMVLVAEQQLGSGDAKDALTNVQAAQAKAKDKDNAAMVLGMAQLSAGQKADAVKTFNGVTTTPNATMIGHLYALYASHGPSAAADAAPAKGSKKKR